jgi:hypothetical protein
MAALDIAAKREGHRAMERNLTAAAGIRRRFRAGPPRRTDRILSTGRAVVEAWALCDELQASMDAFGFPKTDVRAALVLLTGNIADEREETIYVYPVPDMAELPALYEKVKRLEAATNVFPLGVIFKQFDRESEHPEDPEVWAQPWLVFANASRALSSAVRRYAGLGPEQEIFFRQAK